MRVGTLSRRRLCESSLCPSAHLCEDPLQLKRTTFEELPGSKDRRVRRQGGLRGMVITVCAHASGVWRPSACLGEEIKLGV